MKIAGLSDRYPVTGKELTQKKPSSVKEYSNYLMLEPKNYIHDINNAIYAMVIT